MIEGVDQLLECKLVTSDLAIDGQVPAARGPDDEDDDDDEEDDEIREPRRRPIEPLHAVSELHLTE